MSQTIYQVDAFTDKPFKGNPAAVCILSKTMPDWWMQSIAAEMNLAETAFLLKQEDGYGLRWFTPTVEVDLCGHATLAAAHILWETEQLGKNQIARFWTRSGLLSGAISEDTIELDFPAEPALETAAPEFLIEALNVSPLYVGRNRFDYIVEIDSPATLRALTPNMSLLKRVESRGVIITCRSSDPRCHFQSRFFAPACGVDEDPVTGSAHCCLGPYWGPKFGITQVTGYQASARGGYVTVRLEDRLSGNRVHLGGKAVTVLIGELTTAAL